MHSFRTQRHWFRWQMWVHLRCYKHHETQPKFWIKAIAFYLRTMKSFMRWVWICLKTWPKLNVYDLELETMVYKIYLPRRINNVYNLWAMQLQSSSIESLEMNINLGKIAQTHKRKKKKIAEHTTTRRPIYFTVGFLQWNFAFVSTRHLIHFCHQQQKTIYAKQWDFRADVYIMCV